MIHFIIDVQIQISSADSQDTASISLSCLTGKPYFSTQNITYRIQQELMKLTCYFIPSFFLLKRKVKKSYLDQVNLIYSL